MGGEYSIAIYFLLGISECELFGMWVEIFYRQFMSFYCILVFRAESDSEQLFESLQTFLLCAKEFDSVRFAVFSFL